jgi:hypothetical protein
MAASLAVRISFERSARSVSRDDLCSSVDKRGTILTATYSMKMVRLASRTALNCINPLQETIGSVEEGAKKEKEGGGDNDLFSGFYILRQLHFAHAARANRLAQSPIPSRGGNCGSSSGLGSRVGLTVIRACGHLRRISRHRFGLTRLHR